MLGQDLPRSWEVKAAQEQVGNHRRVPEEVGFVGNCGSFTERSADPGGQKYNGGDAEGISPHESHLRPWRSSLSRGWGPVHLKGMVE